MLLGRVLPPAAAGARRALLESSPGESNNQSGRAEDVLCRVPPSPPMGGADGSPLDPASQGSIRGRAVNRREAIVAGRVLPCRSAAFKLAGLTFRICL